MDIDNMNKAYDYISEHKKIQKILDDYDEGYRVDFSVKTTSITTGQIEISPSLGDQIIELLVQRQKDIENILSTL